MAYNPNYNQDQSEVKLSKYNQGLPQLFRLDNLWQKTHILASSGKLISWNWILDRIWCELAADSKDEMAVEFEKFNQQIANLNKVADRDKLYLLLLHKEIFLRKLQNKQGKGTAYFSDSDEDMD